MPKKGKKKGKGGKGKKGKGKKGKKGDKKAKVESTGALAVANAKLWEARLQLTEQSRTEYKESSKRLVTENDKLETRMKQTERDTIDVITYLRKQDQEKDDQIEIIKEKMKKLTEQQQQEKQKIITDLSHQITRLETEVKQKADDVSLMQSELKLVKEFRRKRGQMQKELDEIKESMYSANMEHKATMTKIEQKFFEEKIRLEHEANQKIAELAEKAHTEAIANLDETTKSVYKENVRVSEALKHHMREGEKLTKERDRLLTENEALLNEKEMNDVVVQEKIVQGKRQKELIKELQAKVEALEAGLSHMAREFNTEKHTLAHKMRTENESACRELVKLNRTLELKSREMTRVKRLAREILDQRTEVERFFLESLEQVRKEIAANQTQYRRDAKLAYQRKMLEAHGGQNDYPKIRTFTKSDSSTNSVYKDLEAAERLMDIAGHVDISDLTWEQKERVLRFLFAKMNNSKKGLQQQQQQQQGSASSLPLPPIQHYNKQQYSRSADLAITDGSEDQDTEDQTFLTQSQPELHRMPIIPDITETKSQEMVAS